VDEPEEKLKITKMAWETKGTRSVHNNIQIGKKFSFKNTAKDILITSQLRAALITNKKTKSPNFNIDTINQKVYVFGIASDEEERREVVNEAKDILYVKDVIVSILLIEDLSRSKN
jgi:Predicted periplasmic or secreted lipoprotein